MPTTDPTLEGPSWSAPLNITYAWGDATTQSFVNPAGTFTSAITGAYQTLVQTAMHAWEAVTNVHFTLLSSTSGANIDIGWMNFTATAGQLGVTQYADYTDGTTNRDTFVSGTFVGFEDPAYRAVGGDQTSLYSGYNTTLYQVILHELGHALGLAHVNDPTMLMNPTLGASDRGISAGDVTNIQKIYGAPASGTPSVPTTTATIVRFSTDSGTSSTDFVTNVPAQTVTATLSAALASGESLMGSVNGGTAWTNITAYVSGTGVSWTGLTLSGISSIAMRVTNAAGNGPIAYQSYDIDTTPPTTTAGSIQISADSGSSSTDLVTNVAAPQTVTATLSAGLVSGEKLYGSTNGGLAWTDVTSKVSGTTVSWTGVTLQAGTSAIAFRVGDLAGNFASTTSQAYTLDVTPPTTAVTGIAISADSGASGTDLVTNVAAQTITATLGAGLVAGDRLYGSVDGGATWADVTNKVSGTSVSWSGATLLAGTRNVAFRVVDLAGNAGPTSTQAYTLDVTPPIAAVTGPIALSNDSGVVGDFVTNVANQSISASLNGALSAGDRLLGSTNGGATWSDVTGGVNATTVYWTGAVLNPGTSTLRFKIVDLAGNAGAVTTQAYTLTTTPPANPSAPVLAALSDSGTPGDRLTNVTRPTITGSAPVGSTVTLFDGDGTTVLGTAVATAGIYSITTSLLAEGTHNLTVKATDYAGNVSAYSPALTLTIDATAPTTTVSGLHLADDTGIDGDFVTTVAGQTLSGTLSAPLGVGERLFGSADSGTTWTDVTAMVSGTNLGWSGITLAGNNSLQLRVTDAAGNVGPTATQGYTLDTSPPLATTPVTTPVATTTDPNTLATTVGIPATDPTTPTNPFPAPAATNTVYRFFDSTHGTQFLTSNPAERDTIMATRPDLAYEGKAMGSVDADPNNPNVAPVYRFFDGSNGTHFFTTSAGERDQILNTRNDMVLEQANLFEHATQQSGDVAVYRFFEKTDGSHFFTSDQGEIAAITQHRPDMVAEGKSFYAPKV